MSKNIGKIYEKLCLTALFQKIFDHPLFEALEWYALSEEDQTGKRKAYAAFVSEIYNGGGDLTALVQKLVLQDENIYIKSVAAGQEVSEHIQKSVKRELSVFAELAALTPADFAQDMGAEKGDIPTFSSHNIDLGKVYEERLGQLNKFGYGIFSAYPMFRLSDDKEIEPIVSADKTGISQFIGYELERDKVVANTRAFLQNRPAANTLLCGDAGTGKSSTVKAIVNEFFTEGLRLIELRKDQLRFLPLVMSKISGNPLKFLLFIDDLSFNQNNDDFSMLKAALEGSASATADNAVIYATSNRRHIVKESFADRDGDDVHRNDTLQETLSLSDRFGLTVLFSRPDKKLYLTIVKELAKRYGVQMEEKELELKAEEFALKKGSRSARGAEQFIDSLR